MSASSDFNLVEARINEIRNALESGTITAVELAAECLQRISRYDCRGPSLNAIPLLNPDIFKEAAASDQRRASGEDVGLLDGIPCTVKDSYKVQGMTVASGSPALQDLLANENCAIVQKLRAAGAIILGLTNTPPMMYGGMQRGVLGRAENPYNKDYLAAAFASGSSNGSGVSTAASMAAFGMGSETVSSGRSPASNNGLVAYTPSRGLISTRGVWPLYPTCDVIVPHTRSVDDLLEVLDVITKREPEVSGDFWRTQRFVHIPLGWQNPPKAFKDLVANASLDGVRIGVPSCYVGGPHLEYGKPVYTAPEVTALWEKANADLEAHGAEVVVIDEFPMVSCYEDPDCAFAYGYTDIPRLPNDWNSIERGPLIARSWDAFLRQNKDSHLPDLHAVNTEMLFPQKPAGHPQIAYAEPKNMIQWSKLKSYTEEAKEGDDPWLPLLEYPGLENACKTLEAMRKVLLEDWMDKHKFDMVCFPAAGDVGKADADVSHESAKHAWLNGVGYSNCNRAFRHLGVPSVTVPMGILEGKDVPMGLTFCGRAYSDAKLLAFAKAFESATKRRTPPPLTPALPRMSSLGHLKIDGQAPKLERVQYKVEPNKESARSGIREVLVQVSGEITLYHTGDGERPQVQIKAFVDGIAISDDTIDVRSDESESTPRDKSKYRFRFETLTEAPPVFDEREKTDATVARDQTLTMILVWTVNEQKGIKSRPAGWYGLV